MQLEGDLSAIAAAGQARSKPVDRRVYLGDGERALACGERGKIARVLEADRDCAWFGSVALEHVLPPKAILPVVRRGEGTSGLFHEAGERLLLVDRTRDRQVAGERPVR